MNPFNGPLHTQKKEKDISDRNFDLSPINVYAKKYNKL